MAVAQDYTAMVIARDAIEGAHTIIFVLAINSGKHHRCATLWARRPFVAGVWKVRIGRHECTRHRDRKPRLYALGLWGGLHRAGLSIVTLRARPKHRLRPGSRGLR
jgi:hypothetical protein